MKRSDIPNLTPEQCADELLFLEIEKLLKKARNANQKADVALRDVFKVLEDSCIELNVPTDAENADDLEQAINCYVYYGEFNLKSLMKEIRKQYQLIDLN